MTDVKSPAELGISAEEMGMEPSNGIRKLFGQSFEIKRIENRRPIPVGGSSLFTDELDMQVIGDFDHFDPLFQEMRTNAVAQDTPQLKQWLDAQEVSVDSKLVATLTAFTKKLNERYPITPENTATRKTMYAEAGGSKEVKLSDIFESKSAECAEIAALAQYFLQNEGVNSSFLSGEVLWNKDDEFGEKHSFIVIRNEDKQYIFDPANPTKAQDGMYPSLYVVNGNFDEEMRKGQKRFVGGTNILTKKEAYYGVGNGTNVSPANIAA